MGAPQADVAYGWPGRLRRMGMAGDACNARQEARGGPAWVRLLTMMSPRGVSLGAALHHHGIALLFSRIGPPALGFPLLGPLKLKEPSGTVVLDPVAL